MIILLFIVMYALLIFYWYIEITEPDSHVFLSYISAVLSLYCIFSAIILNRMVVFIAAIMWAIISILHGIQGG